MQYTIDNEEYIELSDVQDMVGIKQTLIYKKVRYGQFPKPLEKKVDITFKRKRKLWKRSEIEDYIAKSKQRKQMPSLI